MKIGIMTFHWADNYGAVLQAYALVKFLKKRGFDAEDINYIPRRLVLRKIIKNICFMKFDNLIKAHKFKMFRKNFLKISKKKYSSNKKLFYGTDIYDIIICGSDQIWNESFMMTTEKKVTLSYFLNFVKLNKKRISYAASLGSNKISQNIKKYAIPEINKFDFISVREDNAVNMLHEYGIYAKLVCDPTILLTVNDYDEIFSVCKTKRKVSLFNYILRKGMESTDKTNKFVKDVLFAGETNLENLIMTPEEWVYQIKYCKCVVTDSFHGTVFAILFHKPFLAINDKNCSMNARIKTLLKKLELENHMIESYCEDKIKEILSYKINWEEVDRRKQKWKVESIRFLLDALGGIVDERSNSL